MENSYRVEVSANARLDIEQAIEYYNLQKPDLGIDFLLEFYELSDFISANPKINQKIYKFYRRFRLKRFPYLVYYFLEDQTLGKKMVIIRVSHSRSNQDRLIEGLD